MRDFKPRRCQVCGVTKSYVLMDEVREIYRVFPDIVDICEDCGSRLNSHVDYYGYKKAKDKKAVRDILLNGVGVTERFESLMNAGYVNNE